MACYADIEGVLRNLLRSFSDIFITSKTQANAVVPFNHDNYAQVLRLNSDHEINLVIDGTRLFYIREG